MQRAAKPFSRQKCGGRHGSGSPSHFSAGNLLSDWQRLGTTEAAAIFQKAVRKSVAKDLVLAAEAMAEEKTLAKDITSVCTLKDKNWL